MKRLILTDGSVFGQRIRAQAEFARGGSRVAYRDAASWCVGQHVPHVTSTSDSTRTS